MYDSKVIYDYAARLESQASAIVAQYVILLGFGLGGGGYILAMGGHLAASGKGGGMFPNVVAGVGAVIGGLIGAAVGRSKGFQLRLAAQTALCHVRVEEHLAALVAAEVDRRGPVQN